MDRTYADTLRTERAAALASHANPDRVAAIDAELARVTPADIPPVDGEDGEVEAASFAGPPETTAHKPGRRR